MGNRANVLLAPGSTALRFTVLSRKRHFRVLLIFDFSRSGIAFRLENSVCSSHHDLPCRLGVVFLTNPDRVVRRVGEKSDYSAKLSRISIWPGFGFMKVHGQGMKNGVIQSPSTEFSNPQFSDVPRKGFSMGS